MRIDYASLFLVAFLSLGSALGAEQEGGVPTTQPMPLPTPAELQQMNDGGQYRICLQQIARVLALRGDPARPYDRNSLLLLRGDCLLHLKDPTTALDAYVAASHSPKPAQKAEARATALLIRKSVGLLFTPKPPTKGGPIGIVDHADRVKAMLALNKELLEDSKPLIDAALDAPNLIPIIDAAPALIDIHSLETAATGSDAEIHPTLMKIAEHARELMTNELALVDNRVRLIESKANQLAGIGAYGAVWWGGAARQGLTTNDREALRRDAAYADRISSSAGQFQGVSRSLGGTGEKWNPVVESGLIVAQHARDVLAVE